MATQELPNGYDHSQAVGVLRLGGQHNGKSHEILIPDRPLNGNYATDERGLYVPDGFGWTIIHPELPPVSEIPQAPQIEVVSEPPKPPELTTEQKVQLAHERGMELLTTGEDVAIIVGDTGSVGGVILRRLAERGHPIVGMNTGRRPGKIATLWDWAEENNYAYGSLPIDLCNPQGIEEQLKTGELPLNGKNINYIVFAAGRNYNYSFGTLTAEQYLEAFKEHAVSPMILSQHLVKQWKVINTTNPDHPGRKHRSILVISSVSVPGASPSESAYGGSKVASEHMAQVMAREAGAFGVTANVLQPGLIANSEMGAKTIAERAAAGDDLLKRIPGKATTNEDVADMAVAMLTSESMLGAKVALNGGRHYTAIV